MALVETCQTPDGPFTVVQDQDGFVLASGWSDDYFSLLDRIDPDDRPEEIHPGKTAAAEAVQEYYRGNFSAPARVPVRHGGTRLRQLGREQLCNLHPGQVVSYRHLAQALGAPSSVRAVASVCARNGCALFVPCHRVIRADGSLGGFAWGLEIKRSLIERERGYIAVVS